MDSIRRLASLFAVLLLAASAPAASPPSGGLSVYPATFALHGKAAASH